MDIRKDLIVNDLGQIPKVAMSFIKLQFCEYPNGYVPKDLTTCKSYYNCKRCGGCIYEEEEC